MILGSTGPQALPHIHTVGTLKLTYLIMQPARLLRRQNST